MNYNNNAIRNQNNNLINNEFMMHNNNSITDNSYDDSKINFSLTNNSTIDTMSNKYNINSEYNNNLYPNNNMNNMIFYNNNNNKIQRNKQFKNNPNQYIRNRNGYNNIYNRINYNNQKFKPVNNNMIDNYVESNMNNKFNINNSFNNINNFYNMNKNFLTNMNNYNINKNSINQNDININNLSNNNINNINENKKQIFFNKLNLNIKLGEEDISKEIIIDIENDDISEIVNNIIKKYNLKEDYFEPLLNIIEQAMGLLINFDKLKITQNAIKNFEKNKKLLDEDINDIDNSLILDLIENRNYKLYFDNMLDDIYDRKSIKERNSSCSYKHRKKI